MFEGEIICWRCGNIINPDKCYETSDGDVCEKCYEKHYKCPHCGRVINNK